MDERDRRLFAQIAQKAAKGSVRQLRGMPGLAGRIMQPADVGGEIIVDEVSEQPEPTEKQREILLCQSALRNLIQSLHDLAKAKTAVSHLVFREPNWRGLLKYMCDSNPDFAGDPNVLTGTFLGIQVLGNWDPAEDEVLVVRPDDLPAIILKPADLTAFAAYWRSHGGSQK